MKIIIIPNNQTMAARHYNIAQSLVEQGHEVHYFMWAMPYGMKRSEMIKHLFTSLFSKTYKYENMTVHTARRLPYFWPYINGWIFKTQLRDLFAKLHADVIFTESFTNETEVPKDLPFVYDLADDYAAPADVYGSPVYKLAFKLLGVRSVMRRQSRNAIAVTAVSGILYKYAKQYNASVHMLRNGIDRGIIESTLKDKSAQPKNKYSMVYVTRFGNWSRAIETLEATVKLKKKFPKLELSLVGDGSESSRILSFIEKHNAESYIHYHGFIYDRKKMYKLMSQSAIGLNISDKNKWRDAAHPIKVIEYSAFGKKVVSTDLSEVKALNYPNIFTFSDKGKGKPLEVAMRKALEDKRQYKDFKGVSEEVLAEYNWSDITQNIIGLAKKSQAISHVTPSYPPSLGGMEKVVQILARIQKMRGLKVNVLTSERDRPEKEVDDFPVDRLKTSVFANTRVMPGLLPKLLRLTKRDVVHLHFASAFAPEIVWLASKLRGFKYVAHMHLDFVPTGRFGFMVASYKRYVLNHVLRSASAVIVFTSDQQKALCDRYGLDSTKVKVIPNGVEEQFYNDSKRSLHKKTRLLFVGRLEAQKNLSQLLYALEGVSDKFETTIVGEGSLESDLKGLAKSLKLKNVKFVGRADGQGLLNYYKRADVFVLPSELEGMPLVLLEAMAMGLPIVATNVTGTRDVVVRNKTGLLVPFNDAKKLRNALVKIGSDKKLYQKFSKEARVRAEQYSWQKVADKIQKLYEGISKPVRTTPAARTDGQIKLWKIVLPFLAAANVAYLAHNLIGSVVTLIFFLFVPGYLLLCGVGHGIRSKWEILSLSLGLSLFTLIAVGLLLNCLRSVGLDRPLSSANIFISLDMVCIALLARVRYRLIKRISIKNKPSLESALASITLSMLPLLAAAGAIRLNNGASNVVTLYLFALIPIVMLLMAWRKELKPLYPYAIWMVGLSILLSNSLRGSYITGHDIHHEYSVFMRTYVNGYWSSITSTGDPYNACLSITILPVVFAKLASLPSLVIFKVVFQAIFAFAMLPIYHLAKRFLGSNKAFIATMLAIVFPTFINDYAFLNRQEVGFIFFSLLILVNFMKLANRLKLSLTVVFIAGTVFSHYSSSYVTIATLGLAWLIHRVSNRRPSSDVFLPLLSLPVILTALSFTFLWNFQITDTGGGLQRTITRTYHSLRDGAESHGDSSRYGLVGGLTQTPKEQFSELTEKQAPDSQYVRPETLHITSWGDKVSRFVNVRALNEGMHELVARTFQLLLIIGVVIMFFRRNVTERYKYLRSLSFAGVGLLIVVTLLPQLSVDYDVTRLFQQCLMFAAIPSALALLYVMKPLGKYARFGAITVVIIIFSHLSGLLPQMLGGFRPQLALNNSGQYYDFFTTHKSDQIASSWLTDNRVKSKPIIMDTNAASPVLKYPVKVGIMSQVINQQEGDSYVYLDYTNTTKGVYRTLRAGLTEYTDPTVVEGSDLLYASSGSTIYVTNRAQ